MATPAITSAALAQNRHQGGLREFVNQKLAPYVKKALKDVCDVDAEYPLQWIGEHLINQSFLHENNPDTTGIKERFFYNFDEPERAAAMPAAAAVDHTNTADPDIAASMDAQHASILDPTTALAEPPPQLYNGDQPAPTHLSGTEEAYDSREQMDMGTEPSHGENNTEMLNGVAEAAREDLAVNQVNVNGESAVDTEMAGTA